MRNLAPVAVLAVCTLVPASARATTARALEMREHLHTSDNVVEGRVVQQTTVLADGHSFVDSTIAVARTLHGRSQRRIVVRQLGPERIVVGDGQLAVGDRVVLFVRRGPHQRFYLTALAQSVFHVRGSGDHAPIERHLDGLGLVRTDPSGRFVPAVLETPPTLAALIRAIARAR